MRSRLDVGGSTALPLGHTLRLDGQGTLQTERLPESSVMSRLRGFLPELKTANEELLITVASSPMAAASVDVENVGDLPEGAPVVEMNLQLIPGDALLESASSSDATMASVSRLVAALATDDDGLLSSGGASGGAAAAAAAASASADASGESDAVGGSAEAAAAAARTTLITEL